MKQKHKCSECMNYEVCKIKENYISESNNYTHHEDNYFITYFYCKYFLKWGDK